MRMAGGEARDGGCGRKEERVWGLRRWRHGHGRVVLGPVLLLLLGALPWGSQQGSSVSTPQCTAPVPARSLILRGGDNGQMWPGSRIDAKRGRARESGAPKYVPGPLEVAPPTLPAEGRRARERAAPTPMQQFEAVRNAAAGGSAFLARSSGQAGRRQRQVSASSATAPPARPSALELIRARLLQLPCEDEASVSLNSNEERSIDESELGSHGRQVPDRGRSKWRAVGQQAMAGLTSDQERALNTVKGGHNIFLTGSAGTGKSFVLKHLIAALKKRHGNNAVHVTASTGAAAVLIGGTTLHAFAGVGLGKEDAATLVKKVYANKLTSARWQRARALIIDEVSMIDAELFDKIDYVARQLKTPGKPFGGLQVVVCGDFFQLPPVSAGSVGGSKRFAFQSEAWAQTVDETVELKRVMRQGEDKFVRVLNELRWGKVSAASCAALLMCQKQDASLQWSDGVELTKLYPYNVNVRAENEKRLSSLAGDLLTFVAEDSIKGRGGSRQRLEALGVEKTLQLKVGAQVMCLKNLDVASGLVNGARGVVVGVAANTTTEVGGKLWPKVKFACGLMQVMTPETWSVLEGDSIVAERKQVPLSLAWAVSVHKCQGMTLDRVEASLSQAFDHGMVYVALSRVKSLSGLRLRGFTPSKATAHPAVVAFYRSLGCLPPIEEDDASRAPSGTGSNTSDLASVARQQVHLSALSTDARQSCLPLAKQQQDKKNKAPDTQHEQHGRSMVAGSMVDDGKTARDADEEMAQIELQTVLHAARTDARLDSVYKRAVGGGYEPDRPRAQDAARPESRLEEQRQGQGQGQGQVARQVHAAVIAATASLTTRHHTHLSSHPPPQPCTADGAVGSNTWRGQLGVGMRQGLVAPKNDDVTPKNHKPSSVAPLSSMPPATHITAKTEVNKHINQWRQRFLSSSVLAADGGGGGHVDGGAGVGSSAPASRHSAQRRGTVASSAVASSHGFRMPVSAAGAERECGAALDPSSAASAAGKGESWSGVQGHVGSSLAHAQCSLLTAAQGTSEPGPEAANRRRRRRVDNESMGGVDVCMDGGSSTGAAASTLATTTPPGSAVWSVREQALGAAHKRRREGGGMSGSEGALGGRVAQRSYARNNEFAPASSLWRYKNMGKGAEETESLGHKHRIRTHTESILHRLRAASGPASSARR